MLQWYHLHMGLKVGPNNGWGWSDPALLTSCFVLGLCKFDGSYAAWVWPQKMANLPIVVQRVSHFCLLKPAERLGFRAAKAKKANRQSWPEWRQNSSFQSQTMFILKVRVKHQYLKYRLKSYRMGPCLHESSRYSPSYQLSSVVWRTHPTGS